MLSVLIANGKGGCGKTTVATTLAACFAARGFRTSLVDFDSQAASEHWHAHRPAILPSINLISAYTQTTGFTRTWRMTPPADTQRVVIDAPAGVEGLALRDLVQRADAVVVPVLPSPIDIEAAAEYLGELTRLPKVRERRARVAVLANRVRESTLIYRDLHAFLHRLDVPFLTRLRDTQNYVKVAGMGMGIHEMPGKAFETDRGDWKPVLEWIQQLQRCRPIPA